MCAKSKRGRGCCGDAPTLFASPSPAKAFMEISRVVVLRWRGVRTLVNNEPLAAVFIRSAGDGLDKERFGFSEADVKCETVMA